MSDLSDQYRKRQEEKKQRQAAYTPVQRVAVALHKAHCHLAHEDQCFWYYEEDDPNEWEQYSHKDYLGRATALMAAVGGNELLAKMVISAIFRQRGS